MSCSCILRSYLNVTKLPAAKRGIKISQLTVFKAIGLPLVIALADIATDGNLLFYMKSYIDTVQANKTTSNISNSTDEQDARITFTETENQQRECALFGLFVASSMILTV